VIGAETTLTYDSWVSRSCQCTVSDMSVPTWVADQTAIVSMNRPNAKAGRPDSFRTSNQTATLVPTIADNRTENVT